MSIDILIDNETYFIDDEINLIELVCLDNSYVFLESKRKIGFVNYKGELLSFVGKPNSKSNNVMIIQYKNKKFGIMVDDVSQSHNEIKTSITNIIESLIDA